LVPSNIYCTDCGAANKAQDAFCFACGRPLRATTPLTQYPVAGTASRTQTGLLTPSYLLKQRYRVLEQIGKGGFGAVYKAEDTQFGNRLVAVKEMSQRGMTPDEIKEVAKRFEHEALLLAGLRHQNLPRIYDHFSESGRWYLVMDFIEGETLEEYLHKARGGHPSVEEALQIAIQLCTVLDYLHTRQPQIIFRDLKPANIMLTSDGHLYLIDFGIARHFKPGQIKDTIAFGSPGYAAPEQYGSAQTTPRSDIYSLGAILHQMATGNDPSKNPFRFAPPQVPGHTIQPQLSMLIMQMLDMDEDKRPTSAANVKQQLQSIDDQLAGKTSLPPTQPVAGNVSLPPTQPVRGTIPSQGRKRMIALIAGVAAVMVIGAYLFSATAMNQNRQSLSSVAIANSSPTSIPTPMPTPTPTPSPTPTRTALKILGPVNNLAGYCQSIGDSSASLDGDTGYSWTCVTPSGQHVGLSMTAACQWQYNDPQAEDRLGNYFAPNSWQCFSNAQKLGLVNNLSGYCQSIGNSSASLDGNTAYNWSCVTPSGQHVGLSMTAACQWQYNNNQAIDRLGNYFDPNSWECWG
jgi:serine/threonine protein kinase